MRFFLGGKGGREIIETDGMGNQRTEQLLNVEWGWIGKNTLIAPLVMFKSRILLDDGPEALKNQ